MKKIMVLTTYLANLWLAIKGEKINTEDSDVYLDSIINRMPAYIFWKNKSSIYLGCNHRFSHLVGLTSSEEIIGKTDFDLNWKNEEVELFREGDRSVMSGNPLINVEEIIKQPNKKDIVMLVSKVPLRNKTGECIGMLGMSMDITELKETQQNLKVAKEKAERLLQDKNEFLRNIEHDIRTPYSGLYSIISHLESIEENQEKKEMLEIVKDSAKELLDYNNAMIEFARADEGMLTVLQKKFDLESLASGVINIEKPAAIAKGLKLELNYSEDIPKYLIGDPNKIQTLLIDLLGNSIKFTKEGYCKLTVDCAKKDEKLAIIQFIIEDTGIGIPEDKQEYIYEKFAKLSPSNQNVYKGAGLGLSMVKLIMQELNGEIELKSELGKGTTFSCTIPLRVALTDKPPLNA